MYSNVSWLRKLLIDHSFLQIHVHHDRFPNLYTLRDNSQYPGMSLHLFPQKPSTRRRTVGLTKGKGPSLSLSQMPCALHNPVWGNHVTFYPWIVFIPVYCCINIIKTIKIILQWYIVNLSPLCYTDILYCIHFHCFSFF